MNKLEMANRFDEAVAGLGKKMQSLLSPISQELKSQVQEIRLRVNSPISLCTSKDILFLQSGQAILKMPVMGMKCLTREDIEECFLNLCDYSVYAHQEDIKNGFITIKGGHRAGICGTAVISNGQVSSIRNVSSINLRVARQIHGASKGICKEVFADGICSTLIAGAPSSGKTTVLRDIARQLSTGSVKEKIMRVAIVDERGEIGGVYRGGIQNDLGYCCDVLNGYPKAEGIMHAIRVLSPDVVICDEVGDARDIEAIEMGVNSGVQFLVSVHAFSVKDLARKVQVKRLLSTGVFKKIVLLENREVPGKIRQIITEGENDDENLWCALNSAVNNHDGNGGAA